MRRCFLFILIFFHQFVASPQEGSIYKKRWQEIDSLIVLKSLPKTALAKVNALYADAKRRNLHDETIKALLYRLSLEENVKDIDINQQAALLKEQEHNTNDRVSKSILDVLLAQKLKDFYQQNFWKNNGRRETISYQEEDITTWTNRQLIEAIDSLFNRALSNKIILQGKSTGSINAILIKGNVPGTRPTLYDLIAHDALDYYKTGLAYITRPTYAFNLNDPHVLASADEFIRYDFSTPDTASHLLKGLKLFQQLMQYHITDNDPTAFIDINLERIEWAYKTTDLQDKDKLHESALKDITDHFANVRAAAQAWFMLANLYADRASLYDPFDDTTNRFEYVRAKKLMEQRLKALPDSCEGNIKMKQLLRKILTPQLWSEAEDINLPNQPFRMLVSYSYVDTIYGRILLKKDVDRVARKKNYDQWNDLPGIKPISIFQQALPQTKDYQMHSVEIKVDGLAVGEYTILCSNSKRFDDATDRLITQEIKFSNLAYVTNDNDIFVLNRETGQPIAQVKADIHFEGFMSSKNKWTKKTFAPIYSDEHGHLSIPAEAVAKNTMGTITIRLDKDGDILQAGEQIERYNYSTSNDEDNGDDSTYEDHNSRVYFFTDRNMYRPGQTVFFKGIVLTKDVKTRQYKLYHYTDSVKVELHDANRKVIDSMLVTLNDYGSFSGKFKLPVNLLTGSFSIETFDCGTGGAAFNVEEYKRPAFFVVFDTIRSSYHLNDTVTITGYVKAFAGNAVDSAKIAYQVERDTHFQTFWGYGNKRRFYPARQEIADSTVNVDEDGKFEIKFLASPDSSVDKNTEPVFEFKVQVSATDANGETREANTDVNVGYKSMVLQINVPEIADASKFKDIYITTKNTQGENIPALVRVAISPLATPSKPYRKRLWERPDQFVMDKQSFESYFPYDEYEEETDYHEWKKLVPVIQDTFSTAATLNFKPQTSLPAWGNQAGNLKQGWYVIEATASDKDSNEVRDVQYIQLYDLNARNLPSPEINFTDVISNSGQVGDTAKLLVGSSEDNVFLIQKKSTGKDERKNELSYLHLSNTKKIIDCNISENDREGFGFYYAFVKHNRFYTAGMAVHLTYNRKNIVISSATYRNKVEPGNKETWTVQLANMNDEKVDAELLTGMYDASLDLFKKHEWRAPHLFGYRDVQNGWGAGDFEESWCDANSHGEQAETFTREYEHIAHSADEFWASYAIERKKIEVTKYSPPKMFGLLF